jgi:hypothetical protein
MSSGTVKNNYNEILTIEVPNQIFSAHYEENGQRGKFDFVAELVSFIFTKRNSGECYKSISELITLSLNQPQHKFENLTPSENEKDNSPKNGIHFTLPFTVSSSENKDQILSILNRIRTIFSGCENLTIQQKFDFCSIERYFMKQYLKTYL